MTRKHIAMNAVESSAIAKVGYDPEKSTLAVQYKSGETYHYHNVSPATHAKLAEADSVMGFMRTHIMGKHAHKKI